MSAWSRRVADALRRQEVVTGIAQVATAWMEEHINSSHGRGPDGSATPFAPLKTLESKFWVRGKPRGGHSGVRTRFVYEKGKVRKVKEYMVVATGYRNGGQPLRDTGRLAGSLHARGSVRGGKLVLTMRGLKYGIYHDRGFKTSGPNYIPMSMKGKRGHGTGNNPHTEGLKHGKDYLMAWRGVTVPARPFILPTTEDLDTLGKSIYLGLKAVLKGN